MTPIRRPTRTLLGNAGCPRRGATLVYGTVSGLTCSRAGCPGPRWHRLALLFVKRPHEGKA